jgi:hypothetical protein
VINHGLVVDKIKTDEGERLKLHFNILHPDTEPCYVLHLMLVCLGRMNKKQSKSKNKNKTKQMNEGEKTKHIFIHGN